MFAPNIKILVVDDMLTMRKFITKSLKEIGFSDLTEAADGAKGWEAINCSEHKFDLIISDWNMPNSTGLDLLKRVRSDSRYKTTPMVLLTAESEKDQVRAAVAAGVSGYIVKPFTLESLKAQLEKLSAGAAA